MTGGGGWEASANALTAATAAAVTVGLEAARPDEVDGVGGGGAGRGGGGGGMMSPGVDDRGDERGREVVGVDKADKLADDRDADAVVMIGAGFIRDGKLVDVGGAMEMDPVESMSFLGAEEEEEEVEDVGTEADVVMEETEGKRESFAESWVESSILSLSSVMWCCCEVGKDGSLESLLFSVWLLLSLFTLSICS